jgi:RNA:NAD 2'-phosphotransferase (TPT1/KptA family)
MTPRRGTPGILIVDAAALYEHGGQFCLAANGVWLASNPLVDDLTPSRLATRSARRSETQRDKIDNEVQSSVGSVVR